MPANQGRCARRRASLFRQRRAPFGVHPADNESTAQTVRFAKAPASCSLRREMFPQHGNNTIPQTRRRLDFTNVVKQRSDE